MLLGQEAFSWNYRFIIRFMKRYNGVVNRLLFQISAVEEGVILQEAVSSFADVIRGTLRKSDIIFQYRPNQFFVVLPNLQEKDTPGVVARIMNAWESLGYDDKVKIEYRDSFLSFRKEDTKEQ